MHDIHDHCSMSRLGADELRTTCEKAVDAGDWSTAYHTAQHHLKTCHMPVSPEQVEFMSENLPGLMSNAVEIVVAQCKHLDEKIQEAQDDSSESAPFVMKMIAASMRRTVEKHYKDTALQGYLTASHLNTYVATRGRGCLFSLIDPELCR